MIGRYKISEQSIYDINNREKLERLKIDLAYRTWSIINMSSFTIIWSSFALLSFFPFVAPYLALMLEFMAFITCVSSLMLGVLSYIHQRKKNFIGESLLSENVKSKKKQLCDKAFFLEKVPDLSDKMDLFATLISTTMQMIGFLGAAKIILDVNKYPYGAAMNTQGISDSTTNIIGLLATVMIAGYFWTKYLQKSKTALDQENKQELEELKDRAIKHTCLSIGVFFIAAGKILASLERSGALSYMPGNTGAGFPLGLTLRVLGGLICIAVLCALHSKKSQEIKDLDVKPLEVKQAFSTHALSAHRTSR